MRLRSIRLAGIAAAALLWTTVAPAMDDADHLALHDTLLSFAQSLRRGNDDAIRAATCAAVIVPACVQREIDLGLPLPAWYLADPEASPGALVAAVDAAYLDTIYTRYVPLIASRPLVSTSVLRIEMVPEGAPVEEWLDPGALGPGGPRAVTAQGTVSFKVKGSDDTLEMPIFRLDTTWCLKPDQVPSLRDL